MMGRKSIGNLNYLKNISVSGWIGWEKVILEGLGLVRIEMIEWKFGQRWGGRGLVGREMVEMGIEGDEGETD